MNFEPYATTVRAWHDPQEQMSLDRLVSTIIAEAKDMLKCERCTVYLLDLKMYDEVRN